MRAATLAERSEVRTSGPRKPLGGHMTKGQRAMAVAKIYPKPEKGGRGKKGAGSGRFSDHRRIGEAREVLRYSPELAGGLTLRGLV